ncbi:hypothetical protein GC176_22650 [bacterium]|nr:hypothetical protein [bacterium]
MPLTISRKPGETIRVSDSVVITVLECRRGRARLSIDAPDGFTIVRGELDSEPDDSDAGDSGAGHSSRGGLTPRDGRSTRRQRRGRPKPGRARMRSALAVMPTALPPLAERCDALARWVLRRRAARRGDDFGLSGALAA